MPFRFSNNYSGEYCGSVEWENRRDRCKRPLILRDTEHPNAGEKRDDDQTGSEDDRWGDMPER